MILIDALYINSFGGKTILELFSIKLINSNLDYHFILDSRLKSNFIQNLKTDSFTIAVAAHESRKNFYLKNINRFSSIICLANIPPPIQTSVKTSIFFHNCLLLNPLNQKVSIKNRIINFLKFCYIKYYNQNDYHWLVQTQLVNKLIKESLNINPAQISTYPVFNEFVEGNHAKKNLNEFVYVSSIVSHKNHKRLIKAFIEAANNTDKEIKLHLTIYKEDLPEMVFPQNLKVVFHGSLSIDNVDDLYNSCEFAIYPSLAESFGLPLIEATNHGCKVIASELPYVHEIIKPSLTFDPYSVESISNAILNAINTDDLPKTKVLVENKLDNFIDFIISQDVQR
jgi:glycosyltransferase involved in cell wall biosynthesis